MLSRLRPLHSPFLRHSSPRSNLFASRSFHGVSLNAHYNENPKIRNVSSDIERQLFFMNDFMCTHTEYQGVIPFSSDMEPLSVKEDGSQRRSITSSWIELVLPLSTNLSMRDKLSSYIGKKVRYGKMFEVIDALAADVAYRHIGIGYDAPEDKDIVIVTASVDGMRATGDISVHEDIRLQAFMTYCGRSSMEIHVNMIQSGLLVGSTQFIMVARDGEKSYRVPALMFENPEEETEYRRGEARSQARITKAKNSLSIKRPEDHEVTKIHELYMRNKHLKAQKTAMLKRVFSNKSHSQEFVVDETQRFNFKYMSETLRKSINLMHNQDRNIHGKIFGGQIMKMGYELAFLVSMIHTEHHHSVHFYAVDDISFIRPVNIGTIIEMTARVTYTKDNFMIVLVNVEEIDPQSSARTYTNKLTFVFECDQSEAAVPEVLPRDYEECVLFLNGRRTYNACFDEDVE
jgi:acyl-coenzyme A thioesterase 9